MKPRPAKQTPLQLGCLNPYASTFRGRLLFREEAHRAHFAAFYRAYSTATSGLLRLLRDAAFAPGPGRIAAFLLIDPKEAPADVLTHPAWIEAQAMKRDADLGTQDWKGILGSGIYPVMRQLCGGEGKQTKTGDFIRAFFEKHHLKLGITDDQFQDVLRFLPSDTARGLVTNAVTGVLKSYLTNRELAVKEQLERTALIDKAHADRPGFFEDVRTAVEERRRWGQACRVLKDTRTALAGEGVDSEMINAAQHLALHRRSDLTALTIPAPSEARAGLAEGRPDVMQRISAALPVSNPEAAADDRDSFRRLSSSSSVRQIESEPWLARLLVRAYHAHIEPLFGSPDEEAKWNEQARADAKLRPARLTLWGKYFSANKTSRTAWGRFFKFVHSDVGPYFMAQKPVKTAPKDDFSAEVHPLLSAAGEVSKAMLRYTLLEKAPFPLAGNEVAVEIAVPECMDPVDGKVYPTATNLSATARGYLPWTKARKLENPIDVFNGLSQLRPDRKLPQRDHRARELFFKAQAMRVRPDGARWLFDWSTTAMAESPSAALAATKTVDRVAKEGMRVGVLHLTPGGHRAAAFCVCEYRAGEWHPIDFLVRRRGSAGGASHRQVWRKVLFIESDDFRYHLSQQTPEVAANKEANQANMAVFGSLRTGLGDLWIKQTAATIADAASLADVRLVISTVPGPLRIENGVLVPMRRLLTLHPGGKGAGGALIQSLAKRGIPISITAARFTLVCRSGSRGWPVKFIPDPKAPGKSVALAAASPDWLFDALTKRREVRWERAARNLPRAVFDPAWKKEVEKALAEERPLDLEADVREHCKIAGG